MQDAPCRFGTRGSPSTDHRSRWFRLQILSAALLSLWGCSDDDSRRSEVVFWTSDWEHTQLGIEFSDGKRTRRLQGSDLRASKRDFTPHSPEFTVAEQGTLAVRGWVVKGNDTIAQGEVAVPLQPNSLWLINVTRFAVDPVAPCGNCTSHRFEIAPERQRLPNEAFWIVVEWRPAGTSPF